VHVVRNKTRAFSVVFYDVHFVIITIIFYVHYVEHTNTTHENNVLRNRRTDNGHHSYCDDAIQPVNRTSNFSTRSLSETQRTAAARTCFQSSRAHVPNNTSPIIIQLRLSPGWPYSKNRKRDSRPFAVTIKIKVASDFRHFLHVLLGSIKIVSILSIHISYTYSLKNTCKKNGEYSIFRCLKNF